MNYKSLILCLFLSFTVLGCASYSQPNSSHYYTTNTQQSHALSGLRICFENPHSADSIGGQFFNLSYYSLIYFIDGRNVFSHNISKDCETFIQIPPGQHILRVSSSDRSLISLGFDTGELNDTYPFELGTGEERTFNVGCRRVYGGKVRVLPVMCGFKTTRNPVDNHLNSNVVQPKPSTTHEQSEQSLEQKLKALKNLLDKGLISESDYLHKRKSLIKNY